MNILIVTDIAQMSHSTWPELYSFISWAKLGHTLTIMTPKTEYQPTLDENNICVIRTSQRKKISLRTIKQIRNELHAKPYDILFATNSKSIPSAAFAAAGLNIKLVCYRGTISGLYRHDPTSYLTLLHPRIDAISCVSNAVEDKVRQQLWSSKTITTTIYKGHKLSWYENTQPTDLSEFSIPEHAFVVVAVANFRAKKGLNVLLEASRQLGDLLDLHILIVGKNSDKPEYDQLISKNNPLQHRIHRVGFRTDAINIIAASTVLVQASTDGEGLPRTVVEAMALGIPPIATTTGGAKEIIDNGKSGFIVPTNDPNAIAMRIRECYLQRNQLAPISVACKNTIRDKLSADKTAMAYIQFFECLLQAPT